MKETITPFVFSSSTLPHPAPLGSESRLMRVKSSQKTISDSARFRNNRVRARSPFRTMLLGFRLLGSRDAGKSGSKGFRSFLSGSRPDLFRAYPMSFSSGAAAADLAAKHEQEASKSRRALLGEKKRNSHSSSRLAFAFSVACRAREVFYLSLSLRDAPTPFPLQGTPKAPPTDHHVLRQG